MGKTDNNSLSRGSSSKRSDTESWQVDFSKYEKDHDADEASKEGNMSKGENYRFSSSQENLNGESRTKEKSSKNLPENEDIYGYSKDLSSTDVDADKPVEVEYEQISSKGDGMTEAVTVDETVERRKKKRRDRRKTNSESSCTKVEIPPFPADDQPKQSPNISTKTCSCIHDIPISSDCKSCSENQSSLNRRSSKVQKITQDNVKEITTKKEATNEKKNEINVEESNTPLNKSTKSQKVAVSCQKCIHEINISDVCEGCKENEKSLDRKGSKKTDVNIKVKTQKDRTAEVLGKEESQPMGKKSPKLQKYEKSCQKCIHDVNLTDLYNDCDENQKSLDRRATKKPTKQNSPNNQSKSASKETREDPLKQVKRRNKDKGSRVPSELTEGESKVYENTLSIGSKPKVVVPSPQGIPRPKPINKRDTNRDSIISDDGFFLEDNMKTDRNGPAEETEEFRKAVESFDQIYLLESGNQSPEITPRESSNHAKKMTKTDEDQKPNLSPSTAWKKLKTGKSFDASENENQAMDFTNSEMRFEQQDSSTFSETKSFNSSESSSFKTQSSSKQTSEEMKVDSSNNKKQSSRQEQSFEAEHYIISGMAESKFESQSQSDQSSTVEEKKSSSKMLKKGTSIELSESSENQTHASESIQKQESLEIIENRKNEEYKLESSQSSKSSKSSKKNNKNRKSMETSENNSANNEETVSQQNTISSVQSIPATKSGNKNIKKGKSIDQPEQIGDSPAMSIKSDLSFESTESESPLMQNQAANNTNPSQPTKGESKKSAKRNKKGKSLDLKDSESPAMSVKSDISMESTQIKSQLVQPETTNNVQASEPTQPLSKKSSKKGKKGKNFDQQEKKDESPVISVKSENSSESSTVEHRKSSINNKDDSWTEIEQAYEGSLPVPAECEITNLEANNESKTYSNKNKKVKSSEIGESNDCQVDKVGATSEKSKHDLLATKKIDNLSDEENPAMTTGSSRKISILGQNYVDPGKNIDNSSQFQEEVIEETTSIKKESKGFLSDEEREELEKDNALVKAIREFQAQSSNESTHSEVSSHVLSDGDLSNEVQYSQLEKKIIQKSIDAQETIKTALEDIEKQNPSSNTTHTETQVLDSRLGPFDNTESVKVQKHSLSVKDGVLIEQTTTERISRPSSSMDSHADTCTIDPESVKNVDGPAKQRKGSARFSKRQGSKSKSPGLGNQSSFSGPEDREEDEETMNNTDLTTRLEETNVRMKKLSEVFNVMCDDPRVEPYQDMEDEDRNMTEEHTNTYDTEDRQTSFHPLTRTTQIIRKECPLDEVIGTMIQKPENLSSSSQFSSSVENNQTSPVMYRAVVTQRHEEKEEEEDL